MSYTSLVLAFNKEAIISFSQYINNMEEKKILYWNINSKIKYQNRRKRQNRYP